MRAKQKNLNYKHDHSKWPSVPSSLERNGKTKMQIFVKNLRYFDANVLFFVWKIYAILSWRECAFLKIKHVILTQMCYLVLSYSLKIEITTLSMRW